MPKLILAGHEAFYTEEHGLPFKITTLSPVQSPDAMSITAVAKRILRATCADLVRNPAMPLAPSMFDDGFESDTDVPLTKAYLAERHREFLASNNREWVDVDLDPLP